MTSSAAEHADNATHPHHAIEEDDTLDTEGLGRNEVSPEISTEDAERIQAICDLPPLLWYFSNNEEFDRAVQEALAVAGGHFAQQDRECKATLVSTGKFHAKAPKLGVYAVWPASLDKNFVAGYLGMKTLVQLLDLRHELPPRYRDLMDSCGAVGPSLETILRHVERSSILRCDLDATEQEDRAFFAHEQYDTSRQRKQKDAMKYAVRFLRLAAALIQDPKYKRHFIGPCMLSLSTRLGNLEMESEDLARVYVLLKYWHWPKEKRRILKDGWVPSVMFCTPDNVEVGV